MSRLDEVQSRSSIRATSAESVVERAVRRCSGGELVVLN